MVTIDFTIEENGYTFKDAIVLPDDHTLTKTQIEKMKQARFQEWLTVINTPQDEVTE
jgi:hypothetical protein